MKSRSSLLLLLLVILFAVVSLPMTTMAQEAGASPAPTPPVKEMTIMQMIKVGGWTMYFLGICSVAAIALTIYNGMMVRPEKMLNPTAVAEVTRLLTELDVEGAKAYCVAKPCLVTNIIAAGLERIDNAEVRLSSLEKGMEEASTEEIGHALVPINYISAAAVTAPMFGLLGTVSGMISAFRAMATGGMGRPELLADNISEALITTATGLIVGIPAMVAYLFFKNKFTKIIASLNRILGTVLEKFTVAVNRASREFVEG